ncbi:MAG: hypothetical protein ABL949_12370 [Fimbriimonadaceae bacterium]
MSKFELELVSPKTGVTIAIESDDRCCYAYYTSAGNITGFVWLYNLGLNPMVIEGRSGNAVCNPNEYCKVPPISVGLVPDDFKGIWRERDGVLECAIYVRDKLTAVVGDGDQPGWCRNASVDGPFALTL